MWFKNLTLYKVDFGTELNATKLNELISLQTFVPCMSNEVLSVGWIPPRKDNESLVYSQGRHMLLTLRLEKKLLPASIINQVTKERAEQIEEQQGFKPGRKQLRDLKEDIKLELLAKAFAIQTETRAWLDLDGGWVIVDTASNTKADAVITLLLRSIADMKAAMFMTQMSPGQCMTNWLLEGEGPSGFSVDMDAELVAPETKATLKFANETPKTEDVIKHVKAGKQCTKLAMTFDSKVSFVLTAKGEIRRIKPLDLIQEAAANNAADTEDDRFDGDMLLMIGELSKLIEGLTESLGGLVEQHASTDSAAE